MLVDGAQVFLEQFSHLFLGQPNGFVLQPDFKTGLAVLGLLDKDLGPVRWIRLTGL